MATSESNSFDKFQNAFCSDPGKRVVGGGANIVIDTGISGDENNIFIADSFPRFGDPESSPPFNRDGWFVRAAEEGGLITGGGTVGSTWHVDVFVICVTAS